MENILNFDELTKYSAGNGESEALKVDTVIYFNDCELVYIRTHISSSNYSINVLVDSLSGKCFVVNYGSSAYELMSSNAVNKLLKSGYKIFSKLDEASYYRLVFNFIIPNILDLYSLNGDHNPIPTQFEKTTDHSHPCDLNRVSRKGDNFLIKNRFRRFDNFIIINAKRRKSQRVRIKVLGENVRFKTALNRLTGSSDNTIGKYPVLRHRW